MPDLYLDPELRPLLDGIPVADFDDATVRSMRDLMAGAFETTPTRLDVERNDHAVEPDRGVIVRVHRPVDRTAPLPGLVWIHGGGYVIGNRLMDGPRLDRFAATLGAVVVSVDYRLAPDGAYPGALDDCHLALRWTVANAERLGIDADRIGIGGLSAGGGLTAALALRVRDEGGPAPAFQLLEAPMLDDRASTPSISRDDLPIWSRTSNTYGWRAYLGELHGTDRVPHHAAAARADDLSDLPPTMVIVGGADGLRDEGLDYARRLIAAGVPTELHVIPGAVHGVTIFEGTRVADRWERLVEQWLSDRLGRG